MGCKGPETFANCPTARYGEGTSWPVKAGAACIGCTMPGFWDAMSPFSRRLPSPIPFAPALTVDQVGMALVAGVGGLAAVHGGASMVRARVVGGHRPAPPPTDAAVQLAAGEPMAAVQPVTVPTTEAAATDADGEAVDVPATPVDAGVSEIAGPIEPPGAAAREPASVPAPEPPAGEAPAPEPLSVESSASTPLADAGPDDAGREAHP